MKTRLGKNLVIDVSKVAYARVKDNDFVEIFFAGIPYSLLVLCNGLGESDKSYEGTYDGVHEGSPNDLLDKIEMFEKPRDA